MRTCGDRVPAVRELADPQPCLAVGLSSGSVKGLSKMDRQKALNSLFGELNQGKPSTHNRWTPERPAAGPGPACGPMGRLGHGSPVSCGCRELAVSFVFSPPHSMFCSVKMHFGEKHEYPSRPECLLPTLVGGQWLFLGHQSLGSGGGACPAPGWAEEGSCPYRVPIRDHPHPLDGAQRWGLPARRSCRNGVLQCSPPGA